MWVVPRILLSSLAISGGHGAKNTLNFEMASKTSSTALDLVPLLKSQADALACLRFAAARWAQADQLDDTERRQSALAEATATVLKTHFGPKDHEEDLFSDGASEEALSDCASALLQLCGFKVVPLSVNSSGAAPAARFGLRLATGEASGEKASIEFIQAVLESCPELAHAAAAAALEPFRSYRLDKLDNDVVDDNVLREFRSHPYVLVLLESHSVKRLSKAMKLL